MTIIEVKRYCSSYLSAVFDVGELHSVVYRLMEGLYGVTRRDLLLDEDREISVDMELLDVAIERLTNGEPLQYVLGVGYFRGNDFKVTSSVLIPRPETEELVNLIIAQNSDLEMLSILDIGTGSGAIAISLAEELRSEVTAWDISEEALKVAQYNAQKIGVESVEFELKDVLSCGSIEQKYDIIVSNPPYVTISEKALMQSNVLDFEPHLALFVDDDNPLIFYKKITCLAQQGLRIRGKLYFEVNEMFGEEVADLLRGGGFTDVVVIDDFRDKARIVTGVYVG